MRELCPNCSKIQNMEITTTKEKEKLENGEIKILQTLTYHCEKCHTFVRSEDKIIRKKKIIN